VSVVDRRAGIAGVERFVREWRKRRLDRSQFSMSGSTRSTMKSLIVSRPYDMTSVLGCGSFLQPHVRATCRRCSMTKLVTTAVFVAAVTAILTFTGTGAAIAQGARPLLVRDVDHPAFEPVRITAERTGGGLSTLEEPFYQVPSGKRLVIEFVSAQCDLGSTSTIGPLLLGINFVTTGVPFWVEVPFFFPMTSYETNPNLWTSAMAQQTRIYANPGDTLHTVAASGPTETTCYWAISGHLVTL
jgi:hypothetical protein